MTAPARIDGLRLWWSPDDGRGRSRRIGGSSFRTLVPGLPRGSVSPRVAAAGTTVDQTVLGLYPVR